MLSRHSGELLQNHRRSRREASAIVIKTAFSKPDYCRSLVSDGSALLADQINHTLHVMSVDRQWSVVILDETAVYPQAVLLWFNASLYFAGYVNILYSGYPVC